MGRNAYGAYKCTCHVHANHEQLVFGHVGFWCGSVPRQYPHVLGTVDEHLMLLEQVLACLRQYTFYCKLKKCSFLCNSTTFLGFDVMPEGMGISDLKVQSLSEWPVPTTVK